MDVFFFDISVALRHRHRPGMGHSIVSCMVYGVYSILQNILYVVHRILFIYLVIRMFDFFRGNSGVECGLDCGI